MIDVPDIFKNTTPGRPTKKDIFMDRNMVLRYMVNPRSIMLTVVPANVDIATQEIIEMAREVDPPGERTLRILTKPDLVDKGAENKVIDQSRIRTLAGNLVGFLFGIWGSSSLKMDTLIEMLRRIFSVTSCPGTDSAPRTLASSR